MMRTLPRPVVQAAAALTAAALLSGCAVSRDARNPATGEVARNAAIQPLTDVGAVRPNIDPELERILENPYALPADARTCDELAFRITQLNRILGPDFDVQIDDDKNEDRAQRGIALVGRMAAGMLIPFRSVVREVSGASSREREYRAALIAGIARRSFLKGYAIAENCALPIDPYAESLATEQAMERDER
ncbi:MAG: hypothetical protein V2J26_11505 [Pacificimonas sp.]|jgi:hypothetical protein|nr:hypothetical protein [Pacificimonas sp.]